MKKITFYTILFSLSVVFGQKISFKIENDFLPKKITFSSIADKELKNIVETNSNFTVDYMGFDEGFYLLKKDNHEVLLYLKPTYNLTIGFDNENFHNTLYFSGDGSHVNNYLQSKLADRITKDGELSPYHKEDFYTGDEAHFLEKLDGYYKGLYGFLFSRNFSQKFTDDEMKDLQYDYSLDLLKYQDAKKFYKQKDSLAPSKSLLEPLNHIHFKNYELYKKFNSYKELAVLKWTKDIVNAKEPFRKQEILESINLKPLKEKVLESLYTAMKRDTPEDTRTYFQLIKKNSSSKKLYANAKAKYDQIKYVEAEKNLSKFKFKNIHGEKASLTDYKGKYILLNIWTSFCESCVDDLKLMDELKKKYPDEIIEFVSIAVDKTENFESWSEIVTSNEIETPQLFFDEAKALFLDSYNISLIPSYVLLSKVGVPTGNDIKSLNSKKTEKIIKGLLKE